MAADVRRLPVQPQRNPFAVMRQDVAEIRKDLDALLEGARMCSCGAYDRSFDANLTRLRLVEAEGPGDDA